MVFLPISINALICEITNPPVVSSKVRISSPSLISSILTFSKYSSSIHSPFLPRRLACALQDRVPRNALSQNIQYSSGRGGPHANISRRSGEICAGSRTDITSDANLYVGDVCEMPIFPVPTSIKYSHSWQNIAQLQRPG